MAEEQMKSRNVIGVKPKEKVRSGSVLGLKWGDSGGINEATNCHHELAWSEQPTHWEAPGMG